MSRPGMTWDDVRVQSATEWIASVHTLHISKKVMTFVFKVLRHGLLRDILYACPNLWWRSCSKCYGMDCFGTYFTHVQTCDDVCVQSATEWTASVHTLHMSKPVMTFVFKVLRNGLLRYILYTCPNLWWRSCSKCYGMDCFGTYFTHVQTCDDVRVWSATEWTASVHTLHMSKPVMTFVFKVLRNGLLRYILYTCPNLWWRSCPKYYGMDCFGTYFTHVQTCDDVRVQSATGWTASVHTLHISKTCDDVRVQSPVLLRTTKCYSTTTLYYKVLLQYYSSTAPYYTVLLQYYSSTTPYQKVLLQTLYYFIATPVLPCTTKYYSCYALQVFLLTLRTKTVNQPASLAGRPANTVRPAGPHGSGRPAGWQDGNKIPNKSTVLSKNYCLKLILYIIYK